MVLIFEALQSTSYTCYHGNRIQNIEFENNNIIYDYYILYILYYDQHRTMYDQLKQQNSI